MRGSAPEPGADLTHVYDVLAARAAGAPDAPALLMSGADPLTYRELHALVLAGVERLRAWGVVREDRVVVPATNDVDGAVTLLAVMCAAVCCPVNPGLAQEEFEALFDILEPTALLLTASGPHRLRRAAGTSDLTVLRHDGRLTAVQGAATAQLLPAERLVPRPVAGESVLLRTSGTTSAGRIVPLTMTGMLAAATASARAYRLTAADRRLNLNPLFHVQGLVGGLVTALVSGSSMACVPLFEPGHALRLLDELAPTWFSASPMTYRALLDHAGGRVHAPRLRFMRSGSAPMPESLRQEAQEAFGVPLIESYGMSEASQIASAPLPPDGPARGMLPTGSRVAVLDARGRIRTGTGIGGEILVRGANVAERYLWPADADAAFVDGWLRTGDLGEVAEDGSLVITGRLKELINRGGEKVAPSEVEEVLLRHPAVGRAVVFGVADGPTERVAAAVVPHPGRTVDERELRSFTVRHLAPFKAPERVVVTDELPQSPNGKVVRSQLPGLLGISFAVRALRIVPPLQEPDPPEAAPAPEPEPQERAGGAPRTPTQAALTGLWTYALGCERVDVDEDFLALGGDSMAAVFLLLAIEETLGVTFSAVDLFGEMRTVELMAAAIERARERP